MLSPHLSTRLDELSVQFETALPYRHVCIDGFFDEAVARSILQDFPSFERTAKTNEFGLEGLKAVYENLSEISPFYKELTTYLNSGEFTRVIEKITGIQGLRWGGESMYGGGTHENVNLAELDAHVDFNYDDRTKEHRRLNLLIYLNKEWEVGWGGEFELHSDPRNPAVNNIKSYLPVFNRAVLMETNERSWHGFPQIRLPAGKEHLSRKSLALYFYTKERPQAEVQGGHGTFYIQRPLPSSFQVGAEVTPEMHKEVSYLISKRDGFLALHQQLEAQASARFTAFENYHKVVLSCLRVAVLGWARQEGAMNGVYADDWIGPSCSGVFKVQRRIKSVQMRFFVPAHAILPMDVSVAVDDAVVHQRITVAGQHQIDVRCDAWADEQVILSFSASTAISGVEARINGDARRVSVMLECLVFE